MVKNYMGYREFVIEGRNAVIEAFRAGKPIDRLFIQDGTQDGPIQTIKREARKQDTTIKFVAKERLDQLSETGKHQGVIAYTAAYEYAEVADILAAARSKNEPPFIILLDNIEDPHNLGAIRESISPFIGIDAIKSHFSRTSLPTPSPSLPITRPIGPVRSS